MRDHLTSLTKIANVTVQPRRTPSMFTFHPSSQRCGVVREKENNSYIKLLTTRFVDYLLCCKSAFFFFLNHSPAEIVMYCYSKIHFNYPDESLEQKSHTNMRCEFFLQKHNSQQDFIFKVKAEYSADYIVSCWISDQEIPSSNTCAPSNQLSLWVVKKKSTFPESNFYCQGLHRSYGNHLMVTGWDYFLDRSQNLS